jgi:hypothetical protein
VEWPEEQEVVAQKVTMPRIIYDGIQKNIPQKRDIFLLVVSNKLFTL